MTKRYSVWLVFLLIALFGVACKDTTAQVALILPGPQTWIDSPLHGSTVPLSPLAIISHSTDPLRIVFVELTVNGTVVQSDPNPDGASTLVTMRQQWTPPAPGDYTIQVRAQNSSSIWGDYASKGVTVQGAVVPPKVPPPPAPPAPPPVVASPVPTTAAIPPALPAVTIAFTVDKTSLVQGQCTMLHWQVTNASQVFLDNAAANLSGSKQECPSQTTTYTLRVVTLDKQTVQRTVSISVAAPTRTSTPQPPNPPPQTGCSGTPNIASFTASPSSISAGGSSMLNWGAVTNANAVEIDQGIGGIGTPGSTSVSPGSTTTYTLIAHCGNNVATRTATVTVIGQPPPPPPSSKPTLGNANFDQSKFYFNSGKCGPRQVTISVISTDASSMQIFFRAADQDGGSTTSWTTLPMSGSGTWSRTISDTDIPGITTVSLKWFQFYFVATNSAGSTTSAHYDNMVTLQWCAGIG